MAAPTLVFTVNQQKPELVRPAKPTPHKYKPLSDIDNQLHFRFQVTVIQVYAGGHPHSFMQGEDPVKVIRGALAQALVYYYPLAGRLREGPNLKLWVDCTGEGVLFVEADADVTLQQLQDHDALQPPFNQLRFQDVPGSSGILDSPLLLFQITRLRCGGFILAMRFNHTMMDVAGIAQLWEAIGEFARRNHDQPSVLPVWKRHLLNSRYPTRITRMHREYDDDVQLMKTVVMMPMEDMVERSFFFGPAQLSVIRNLLPLHLRHCSRVELLTAFIWRCRTVALRPHPETEMRVCCIVNSRNRSNSVLPPGFYGNAFSFPAAVATAGKLCESPLAYAVKLVRKAKEEALADMEYIQSVADFLVLNGRRHSMVTGTYYVSDITHAGLRDVDYRWGKAVYAGVATAMPKIASFFIAFKNKHDVEGILVPICLPVAAMDRFQNELQNALEGKHNAPVSSSL